MKNSIFFFGWLADQQKTQFFVTVRSRNHVGDRWKKIIQYGKKSWTNKPFHQSVPSHSTTLLLPEGFYWSNIYIGIIKVSIRRNNKNVEIYRSKALEYKVGPNGFLFTWYTLSFWGARMGDCDIKATDGAKIFAYLRTRMTSGID